MLGADVCSASEKRSSLSLAVVTTDVGLLRIRLTKFALRSRALAFLKPYLAGILIFVTIDSVNIAKKTPLDPMLVKVSAFI